ncbi:uncharacterized protein [Narcine bancroftii]|uniref:uncharacterized protein isoform X2 n=1 Tax=Narcine bancroftii TaxID=1343680 RepID=UPI0038313D3E
MAVTAGHVNSLLHVMDRSTGCRFLVNTEAELSVFPLEHTCQTLARGPNLDRDMIIFGPQDYFKNVLEVARWPPRQYSAWTANTINPRMHWRQPANRPHLLCLRCRVSPWTLVLGPGWRQGKPRPLPSARFPAPGTGGLGPDLARTIAHSPSLPQDDPRLTVTGPLIRRDAALQREPMPPHCRCPTRSPANPRPPAHRPE